jgi:DNA-binding NarL/FixJ family response regulator
MRQVVGTCCTKVLLVSHRPDVCAQVRLSIENRPGLVVVGEAANYAKALAIAAVETPDFIVIDVAADDEGALDHISDLVYATKRVLVVSDICEKTMLNCVRRAGATDLVPRARVVEVIMRSLCHDPEEPPTMTEREMAVM